jgi:putative transposase
MAMRFCGASIYYRSKYSVLNESLRTRIKENAGIRIRYGYRRIHVLLRREGWSVNCVGPQVRATQICDFSRLE